MRAAIVCLAFALSALVLVSANTAIMSQKEMDMEHASLLEEMRQAHPVRPATRAPLSFSSVMLDRANLLFRALDYDHDKLITAKDINAIGSNLGKQLAGVSAQQFASFLEAADHNGDNALSLDELVDGIQQGLPGVQPSLLETAEKARFFGGLGGLISKGLDFVKGLFGGKKGAEDDGCVICQYIVERAENNVKQSGVIPALTGAEAGPSVFLELEQKQNPFDYAAANIIGSTRLATRYQRQLERQKYNEIYRVVDITLDDVCEQGMPSSYYPLCKQVYQAQSDIVDGLRYQYRPADICYRVGMCGKGSYITKGIHSRFGEK